MRYVSATVFSDGFEDDVDEFNVERGVEEGLIGVVKRFRVVGFFVNLAEEDVKGFLDTVVEVRLSGSDECKDEAC